MIADVDITTQWLDLLEQGARDGHAAIAALNEEKVHAAPILHINTVFQHLSRQSKKYRSAASAY